MHADSFTIIDEGQVSQVDATLHADEVRLSLGALKKALGWELKPEGLCKGNQCVPVDPDAELVDTHGIDLAEFAGILGRPLALDVEEKMAYLGSSAADQSAQLSSLVAPDFTLPDLDGKQHSLRVHRIETL